MPRAKLITRFWWPRAVKRDQVKFLVDAQLPIALARWLTVEAGHEAIHVDQIGLRTAEDTPIWRYAIEHTYVIVTKDEDFASRIHQSSACPAVVWLRIGNCSRSALLDWFAPLLPKILRELDRGERLIEVR